MKSQDNRNMFIFIALSMAILFAYQVFIATPEIEKQQAKLKAQLAATAQQKTTGAVPSSTAPTVITVNSNLNRDQALALSARVPIETKALKGSISLTGGRIDDLYLLDYNKKLDPKSGKVEWLVPKGAKGALYIQSGFVGQNIANLPGPDTQWLLMKGTKLSVGAPITLGYDNGAGLLFQRELSIDEHYLISVRDSVFNTNALPVTVSAYATVERIGDPKSHAVNAFEGAYGIFSTDDTGKNFSRKYATYADWIKKSPELKTTKGGWIGITDKYWLASVIPDQTRLVTPQFKVNGKDDAAYFQSGYIEQPTQINAGQSHVFSSRVFAGAKPYKLLKAYEDKAGIPRLTDAIDWGNIFFWVSKPIFFVLDYIFHLTGNFGIALLGLTVIIRALFWPFAHQSYESMIKMKALQPKLEAIKARHKDDQQQQQLATMELYKNEKINVMAGCLPMLLQLPVFLALSKVFFVTIEMRHTPFFDWIQDLSDREPTTIWNLFGLLPYDPATLPLIGGILDGFAHLGIWAIVYGLIMWLTQAMTPMTTVDPLQKKIFALMPIFIPFFMASLPVGLLIYYSWSSILTIVQQYFIYRRFKVENPIDALIHKLMKKTYYHSENPAPVEVLPPEPSVQKKPISRTRKPPKS